MIDFIFGLIVGGFIGWRASLFMYRRVIEGLMKTLNINHSDLDQIRQHLASEVNKDTEVQIKIESHGGTLYAYRQDTDEFLAQGLDRDSLLAAITALSIADRIVIVKDNGADLVR